MSGDPRGVAGVEPQVGIVVLTWNNERDVFECLASVDRLDYRAKTVVVVDNGSDVALATIVGKAFPSVRVISTCRNLGVPAGYNVGIEAVLASGVEYVLILNDDTTMAPDTLRLLVDAAIVDPTAAILMPKVLLYDEPCVIWSAGARYRRFPPAIVFVDRNRPDAAIAEAPRYVEYAPACGLLVRRKTFERVGLLDSGYFFFYEDWDFCERVRANGQLILYVPAARLWHKVSRTSRRSSDVFWRVWGESSARFFRRYGGPAPVSLAIHLGYIVAREVALGNARGLPGFLRGVLTGLARPLGPPPAYPRERQTGSAEASPSMS